MKTSVILAFAATLFFGTTTVSACCVNCNMTEDDCYISDKAYVNSTDVREVEPFSRVKLSNAISVNIVQGDEQSVVINADESIINKVKTEVNGSLLSVYIDEDWLKRNFRSKSHKVVVDITVPELTALDVSGACNVDVKGFRNENFTMKASGASNVVIDDFIVKEISSFEASGASNVKIFGKGEKVIIRASGASDVISKNFAANIADVHASGASDVNVTAYDEIRVDCSGASDVDYYGGPKAVDISSSGASDVTRH